LDRHHADQLSRLHADELQEMLADLSARLLDAARDVWLVAPVSRKLLGAGDHLDAYLFAAANLERIQLPERARAMLLRGAQAVVQEVTGLLSSADWAGTMAPRQLDRRVC
jgi:hypothetical protein